MSELHLERIQLYIKGNEDPAGSENSVIYILRASKVRSCRM